MSDIESFLLQDFNAGGLLKLNIETLSKYASAILGARATFQHTEGIGRQP